MRDTVFSPSFGNRPAFFVGRERIIRTFVEGLESRPGDRDRSLVLLGQRGSGKTVLLWELADRARELGYVVATPTAVSEGMLARIVEKVQDDGERYVGERGARLSGGSLGALGFSFGLEFTREIEETKSFAYKLTKLARTLTKSGHGILVLVDELQANSEDIRQLVTVYQELVGEQLDVALVMAGLPSAVSATLNDRVLTFLNRARKVSLPPLSTGEVDGFFARAFKELGVRLPTEERTRAARAAEGSPYLLQLIGHNIVLSANDEGELPEGAVNGAIAAAVEDFENDVCHTTLVALSQRDVDFLRAMTPDEGASRVSEVAERMGVTYDYAQKYRRRLIDSGVIQPAGRGLVEFAVPFLRDYLRREE